MDKSNWPEAMFGIMVALCVLAIPLSGRYLDERAAERAHVERMAGCHKES